MPKLTTIKYSILHPQIANFPKYMVLAGVLYSSFLPYMAVPANATIVYEKPALLAMAYSTPAYAISSGLETEKNKVLTIFSGSTFISQTNPITPAKITKTPKYPTMTSIVAGGEKPDIKETRYNVIVTAYSSTPDQTDDSPFITAMGSHVRDGIIAANFLPFGTKVRFPEMFGDKIFVVEDRMAKRFSHKADIWMETREAALQFGARRLTLEILE